ncbi:MAG: RMD1 family protein, partial [Candidatus Nanoarchaeia archaeon]
LENASHLALYPLTIRTRSGIAVLFKYGTAILFDMTPLDEAEFIESLSKYAQQVHKKPESEEIEIVVDPNVEEGPRGGSIYISSADIQRIQILAEVLSRNLILSYYESNISENFDTIEPIAKGIMERGYLRSKTTTLVKHIGSSLLSLHKMVGMVEVGDKPELLWEYPFLERLYHKLENEYELTDRRISIEKKLQIISQSAESILDLLQTNRN